MGDNPEIDKKRITAPNILFAVAVVLVIQLVSLLITYENIPTYTYIVSTTGYSYAPLGTSSAGSAGNAVILVLIVFASTLALVWVLARKMILSFKVLIFGSVSISAFLLTLITFDSFSYKFVPDSYELPLGVAVSLVVVALIGISIFVKNYPWLSTGILAFVGAEVGSFFASTLPPLTALLLPIVFSIYDVYAVFRGPLKQLIGMGGNMALTGMSIKAGEFTLGLGDIVFYTMLPSLALFYLTPLLSLSTILVIDVGVVVTLYLLSRKKLLPGLPIPMLLGVLLLAVFLV
ncbi:MAG: presenilin [Nitrososphaerales archaeon]|nr:presenilin [Nitrososphaerales archaeon]